MSSTNLTIRLPEEQREALRRAAGTLKKTESEYVRDLLAGNLRETTLAARLGDLIGSLDSSAASGLEPHPLKEHIGSRNRRK